MRKFEMLNKFGITGKASTEAVKIALETNVGVCMCAECVCSAAEELSAFFESRKNILCLQAAEELLQLAKEVKNFSPDDDGSFIELAIDIHLNVNPRLSRDDYKREKAWTARMTIISFMTGIVNQLNQMRCI